MVTFRVDEVDQAAAALPTQPLASLYRDALALGGDPATPVIDHGGVHPLLAAVGIAFAQHRALVLSPDAIWLTIAQGVAQHVRFHAEALRPRLVRHAGRKRLTLEWPSAMPVDAASWAHVVSALRQLLADDIGEGRARLFECDFSTSTEVERIASQVVLLDAYSPYFSYWMMCVCGIPSITLSGTVADWRRIRERIDVIAELDLGFWCNSLAPIADQFVRAAAGDLDVAFWRRIYNPMDAYGGKVITGWITRLYPYLKSDAPVRNPMLALSIDKPRGYTPSPRRPYSGPGLRSDDVPNTVSRVTVHVVDQIAHAQRPVALVAGLAGVAQDDDGALRPIVGWYLEHALPHISDVIDRIARDHRVTPAPPDQHATGPAEVVALYKRLASATLFEDDRAWHLRPADHNNYLEIAGAGTLSIGRIFDLPGGRSLCYAADPITSTEYWVLCRVSAPPPSEHDRSPPRGVVLDSPEEIRVLGASLAALLDAALDADGEIEHLEVGRLDQLLRWQRERSSTAPFPAR